MRTRQTSRTTQLKLKKTAVERRLHPYRVAAGSEQIAEELAAAAVLGLARGVQRMAEITGALPVRDELRVHRIVKRAAQHLLFLALHRRENSTP
jgi:hypothetical protein